MFEPKKINSISAPLIWLEELLAAPAPSDVARPATVGASQTRAQLSTLLVTNTARTSFATREFSSFVHREEEDAPIDSAPYFVISRAKPSAT
ncbi:MAG: hypothetical protein HQK97_07430 [Nitrospirae bacterium]|nr:hypothetical protein [Nitrospirota bacterium]